MLSILAEQAGIGTPGELAGHCMVCGRSVHDGHRAVFSSTFTSWQHLQMFPDPVLCPPCHEMLTNPQWRRSNWLLTPDGPTWLTRGELAAVLRNPPAPPFVLYTTASFKKHGWIILQQRVNLGHDVLLWAWDEQPFAESRGRLVQMLDTAEHLLGHGLTRTELTRDWKLQHIARHEEAYKQWMAMKMLPCWRWVVWVAHSPNEKPKDLVLEVLDGE